MGIEGNSPTTLVQVTVQADWTDVVAEALRLNSTGSFWVSCYKRGSPSVHGAAKVSVVGDKQAQFSGRDGIVLEAISNYSFKVQIPEYDNIEVEVYGTGRKTSIAKIACMDVSPEGALFVTGSEDGILRLGESATGRVTKELKGHVQYVNTCKFFPSGQVILSGGGDFLLKVWSVLDGSCPVTMKGHVKAVTDTAIIDRGRNILSSSSDGTVKLWEVASGATIRTLMHGNDKVNAIAVDTWATPLESKIPVDTREIGTEGKLVIAASNDGHIYGLDVRASEEAFQKRSFNQAPVRSCAYSAQHSLVATGTSEGVVEVFDIRKFDQVLSRHQRGTAGVSSLLFSEAKDAAGETPHLIVGCDDSGLYETKAAGDPAIQLRREYVGFDLDGPCHARLVAGGPALTAITKDGGLLRYSGNLGARETTA
ncbi:proteasomal ATPase-associated factor 1 [Entomortierella parvispora]|uniref:Proteasomal ATPase-associated factor 1 n=1 Tax=Entomortierella parvispora TaxID=205924 RepID=A0A9P3LTC7_9FUNG|nr:proteasomal ATPase-associated factor 1 [Entomortierella parvispora]